MQTYRVLRIYSTSSVDIPEKHSSAKEEDIEIPSHKQTNKQTNGL
jgi:hypothetical protein